MRIFILLINTMYLIKELDIIDEKYYENVCKIFVNEIYLKV